MFLAGIPVDRVRILPLARKLREARFYNTAERLEYAYDTGVKLIALSISEREDILQVLVNCPEGLCELRAVLLKQQEWRVREGSASDAAPAASEGERAARPTCYCANPQVLRSRRIY